MEEVKSETENLVDHVGNWIETYYKLAMVNITEKATTIVSNTMAGIAVLLLGVLVLLFAGVGVAWWIGEAYNNMKLGFFIVGGFFLLLLAIIIAIRKQIVFPFLRDAILKRIYE